MKNIYFTFGFIYLVILSFTFVACDENKEDLIQPNCHDEILNQDEVKIDCGGSCPACDPCENGQWDDNETYIDCGGNCAPCSPCANGQYDEDLGETGIDCGPACVPCSELCNDGLLNGNEDAIDCGGQCPPCEACDDGILNGEETGIDCGGSVCDPCPETAGDCTNGIQDGDEFGVDCGGSSCVDCEYYVEYSLDGEQQLVLNATTTLDGSLDDPVMTITLPNNSGDELVFVLTEHGGGWNVGVDFLFGEDFAPENLATFDPLPLTDDVNYNSDHMNASGILTIEGTNINLEEYPEGPAYIQGTFGNLELVETDGFGTETVSITEGSFFMEVEILP